MLCVIVRVCLYKTTGIFFCYFFPLNKIKSLIQIHTVWHILRSVLLHKVLHRWVKQRMSWNETVNCGRTGGERGVILRFFIHDFNTKVPWNILMHRFVSLFESDTSNICVIFLKILFKGIYCSYFIPHVFYNKCIRAFEYFWRGSSS